MHTPGAPSTPVASVVIASAGSSCQASPTTTTTPGNPVSVIMSQPYDSAEGLPHGGSVAHPAENDGEESEPGGVGVGGGGVGLPDTTPQPSESQVLSTTVVDATVDEPKQGSQFVGSLGEYLWKWKGQPNLHHPQFESWPNRVCSAIFAFVAIATLSAIDVDVLTATDLVMIVGSFGASAVLLYSAIRSPLAQPWNVVGGHMVSAFVGVSVEKIWRTFGDPVRHRWASAGLAVGLAVFAMDCTKSTHPPGGATALIAVTASDKVRNLGFLYVVMPMGAGAALMVAFALLLNNLRKTRMYPQYWW